MSQAQCMGRLRAVFASPAKYVRAAKSDKILHSELAQSVAKTEAALIPEDQRDGSDQEQ